MSVIEGIRYYDKRGDTILNQKPRYTSNYYLLRKILLVFLILFAGIVIVNLYSAKEDVKRNEAVYELYPTQNIYTFLKLNTKNGKISQVQYSTDNDQNRIEIPLNTEPLAAEDSSGAGRFVLEATHNIYNFLLLDRVTGQVWQVQWHTDHDKRGIIAEIKSVQ